MNTHTHAFVTVDMRDLKASLVARARAERVSTSTVVRRAVEKELGRVDVVKVPGKGVTPTALLKLSLRLTAGEAHDLDAKARHAGLSRGAFVGSLLTGTSAALDGATRQEHVAALGASCAELSTLSRNIYRLTSLLRDGRIQTAQLDGRALEVIGSPIRKHLSLAARLLAELQPARVTRPRDARRSTASTGDEDV